MEQLKQPSGARQLTKWVVAVVGVFAVLAGVYYLKLSQFQSEMAKHADFKLPPESITTASVITQKWPSVVSSVGTLKPVQGVVLRADLSGDIDSIGFESGAHVKKGDLMVQQDIAEELAQLRAAESKQQLADLNLKRIQGLVEKRVSAQSTYDEATALFLETQAKCEEIRAVIAKKTIRAPFAGLAGIRMVNPGEYLRPGDPIVQLQSLDPVYVNFTLPQQNLEAIKVGHPVKVRPSGLDHHVFEGNITALDSVVDEATRNFLVQATLANREGLLRPGMFVGVEVWLPEEKEVRAIPATSISYAPYGDSVYVVQQSTDEKTGQPVNKVMQKFVKTGEARGDMVEITSGLSDGDVVATSGVFKLRPQAEVVINNEVQPGSSLNPQPADQ